MNVYRIDEARLTAQDEADIVALLDLAFPEPPTFEGRSFFYQRHHTRFVVRDPDVVGHLAVGLRAVRLGGSLLTMAGFAEVSTHPNRRGEGIAARLVQAGLEEARAMRADFAALFGHAGVYQGAGFVPAPNLLRFVRLNGVNTGTIKETTTDSFKVFPLGDLVWDDAATVDLVGGAF